MRVTQDDFYKKIAKKCACSHFFTLYGSRKADYNICKR